MVVALLLACAPPDAEPSPVGADSAAPRVDQWPASPATYPPDEVPGRIEAALTDGVSQPWALANDWFDLFDHADRTCPSGSEWNLPINYGGCTTSDGWHFAGTATFSKSEGAQVGFQMTQDCEVVEPDGTRFFGSGSWGVNASSDAGNYSVKASGMYAWPSADGLLGDGFSAWLSEWGEMDATSATFNLEGTLALRGEALSFEGIAADAACPGGAGEVGLRDPSGGWYTLTFSCDGCGPLAYDGVEVGTACVDLSGAWAASAEAIRPIELPWR